jgi:hypothetical protein
VHHGADTNTSKRLKGKERERERGRERKKNSLFLAFVATFGSQHSPAIVGANDGLSSPTAHQALTLTLCLNDTPIHCRQPILTSTSSSSSTSAKFKFTPSPKVELLRAKISALPFRSHGIDTNIQT